MIHTVSLEMAKKLKAAGWEKETEHIWLRTGNKYEIVAVPDYFYSEEFPAPTAGELLREMPRCRVMVGETGRAIAVRIVPVQDGDTLRLDDSEPYHADTPEDALAAAWIDEYGQK